MATPCKWPKTTTLIGNKQSSRLSPAACGGFVLLENQPHQPIHVAGIARPGQPGAPLVPVQAVEWHSRAASRSGTPTCGADSRCWRRLSPAPPTPSTGCCFCSRCVRDSSVSTTCTGTSWSFTTSPRCSATGSAGTSDGAARLPCWPPSVSPVRMVRQHRLAPDAQRRDVGAAGLPVPIPLPARRAPAGQRSPLRRLPGHGFPGRTPPDPHLSWRWPAEPCGYGAAPGAPCCSSACCCSWSPLCRRCPPTSTAAMPCAGWAPQTRSAGSSRSLLHPRPLRPAAAVAFGNRGAGHLPARQPVHRYGFALHGAGGRRHALAGVRGAGDGYGRPGWATVLAGRLRVDRRRALRLGAAGGKGPQHLHGNLQSFTSGLSC